MLTDSHGISIGMEKRENHFFVSVKAVGTLTHEDYQYMKPMLEGALEKLHSKKVNVLVDISEFNGWELRAAWDDFQIGRKYSSEFNKIALWGKPGWGQWAAKIARWFVSGDAEFFDDLDTAMIWLLEE
jgi:hypothetical protein